MLSRFRRVRLCVTLWTAALQAPLSTGFSRQEHWSVLPLPSLTGKPHIMRINGKTKKPEIEEVIGNSCVFNEGEWKNNDH